MCPEPEVRNCRASFRNFRVPTPNAYGPTLFKKGTDTRTTPDRHDHPTKTLPLLLRSWGGTEGRTRVVWAKQIPRKKGRDEESKNPRLSRNWFLHLLVPPRQMAMLLAIAQRIEPVKQWHKGRMYNGPRAKIWRASVSQRRRMVQRVCASLEEEFGNPRLGNPADPVDDLIYLMLSNRTRAKTAQQVYQALGTLRHSWDEVAVLP